MHADHFHSYHPCPSPFLPRNCSHSPVYSCCSVTHWLEPGPSVWLWIWLLIWDIHWSRVAVYIHTSQETMLTKALEHLAIFFCFNQGQYHSYICTNSGFRKTPYAYCSLDYVDFIGQERSCQIQHTSQGHWLYLWVSKILIHTLGRSLSALRREIGDQLLNNKL